MVYEELWTFGTGTGRWAGTERITNTQLGCVSTIVFLLLKLIRTLFCNGNNYGKIW